MSANDYIHIDRKTFKVEHRDYDTDHCFEEVGTGKDLDDAIDTAQKYMQEQMVSIEYGVYFD